MKIESFAVEVCEGEIRVNGAPEEHLIDIKRGVYRISTTLVDSEELRRVIQCALCAGQAVGRAFVLCRGEVQVLKAG